MQKSGLGSNPDDFLRLLPDQLEQLREELTSEENLPTRWPEHFWEKNWLAVEETAVAPAAPSDH